MKKRSASLSKIDSALIILIFLLISTVFYIMLLHVSKCRSFECFKSAMEKCKRVKYINEQTEASWGYEIKGKEDDLCKIEVTLLLAKKGELEVDKLVGYSMDCFYPEGEGTYPEKDLEVCHGSLKEGLQEIIIKKLHTYLIENLGEVDEALKNVV